MINERSQGCATAIPWWPSAKRDHAPPSEPAFGRRASRGQAPDSDGDGVSDETEEEDGTDPSDRGSFRQRLKSPIFTKYNTFLEQLNFLELIASGSKPVSVTVEVFRSDGAFVDAAKIALLPGQQFDLFVNDLVDARDTFGVAKISFPEGSGIALTGRMSTYRVNASWTGFGFAYARGLRSPLQGDTYATGNTIDPAGTGNLVPNWAEIVNVGEKSERFTYNLYNQVGTLVFSTVVNIPPGGERDLQAGHEIGEGVYLSEFIPHDGAARYLAAITRFSFTAGEEANFDSFDYAFPNIARAGSGNPLYASTTNVSGECWFQSNWVEVVNVGAKATVVELLQTDMNGIELRRESIPLSPKAQFHYNAVASLPDSSVGMVTLSPRDANSLVAQSLVYYHDCSENNVQSAYATPARIPLTGDALREFQPVHQDEQHVTADEPQHHRYNGKFRAKKLSPHGKCPSTYPEGPRGARL